MDFTITAKTRPRPPFRCVCQRASRAGRACAELVGGKEPASGDCAVAVGGQRFGFSKTMRMVALNIRTGGSVLPAFQGRKSFFQFRHPGGQFFQLCRHGLAGKGLAVGAGRSAGNHRPGGHRLGDVGMGQNEGVGAD